jgi:antitoxin HicB
LIVTHQSFAVLLVPDPDVGGFTVTVPAIPEFVTEGDTEECALAMAREAIALDLGYAIDHGLSLPTATISPVLRSVDVPVPLPAGC